MQFAYKFDKGNSVTFYVEVQDQWKDEVKHYYWYFGPSYNHYGKWSISLFYDNEKRGKPTDSWLGLDYTININDTNQLSLFYGSQQGGLVCANGSCVFQPDFDDGMKVTLRSSF